MNKKFEITWMRDMTKEKEKYRDNLLISLSLSHIAVLVLCVYVIFLKKSYQYEHHSLNCGGMFVHAPLSKSGVYPPPLPKDLHQCF